MASTVSAKLKIIGTAGIAFILSIAFAQPAKAQDEAAKFEFYQLIQSIGKAMTNSGVDWKALEAENLQREGGANSTQIAMVKQLAGKNLLDLIDEAQNSSSWITGAGKSINTFNTSVGGDHAKMKSASLLTLTYWEARSKSKSDQSLLTQSQKDQAQAKTDYSHELGEIEQQCDASVDMKTLCQNASTALDGDGAEFSSDGATGSEAATVLKAALSAK